MNGRSKDGGIDRRDFLKTAAAAGAVGFGLSARSLLADDAKPADGRVKTRPLGATGMTVSVIGFGSGALQPQHLPILQAAFEAGITLYDTAWAYGRGQSEVAIGKLVETLKDREAIHIVTKASGWSPPPRGTAGQVYQALEKRFLESLERLKTDYVDVFYWPHGATNPKATRNEACRDALAKLKEKGLVRHVGTSSHANYAKLCEGAIEDGFYEVLMPVLNIGTLNPEQANPPEETPPEAKPSGEKPSGGKPSGGKPSKKGRPKKRRGRRVEDMRKVIEAAKRKKVGLIGMKVANEGFLGASADALLADAFPEDSGLSRHQKLYAYILRQEAVSSVVVGIHSARHLMEAIEVGQRA